MPSGEVVAVYSDVTDRKEAELALKDSERKYEKLADLLPETIFESDEHGKLLFANQNAFAIFGYNKTDFDKGINVLDHT